MVLKPLFELGVDEAYNILTEGLRVDDLPPLDAIENEDWGRDLLLSRLLACPAVQLAAHGVSRPETPPDESDPPT